MAERVQRARTVAVTNMYRNQSILFHTLGGGVRLAPFETRELTRDCLVSPELSELVRTGVVRVREIDADDAAAAKREGAARSQAPAQGATTTAEPARGPGQPEGRGSRRR